MFILYVDVYLVCFCRFSGLVYIYFVWWNGTYKAGFVENFDMCAIRNTIQDFSMFEKKISCIPKLVPISNQKICFPWVRRSLKSHKESVI